MKVSMYQIAECIRLQIPVCGMYVYVWVLYSTFKRVIHTKYRQIHAIYQSILHVSCMYLMLFGVCMCLYVYVCCAYNMCSFLYCMYLPVFFAAKIASRSIWHTYRQYIQIHTNTTEIHTKYMQKYMQIHANTYNSNKGAKMHILVIKCYICMYLHVWVIHVCYM